MFVGPAWLGPIVYVGLLLLSLGLLFSPSVRESATGGTAEAKPSMVITAFNGPGIGLGMPLNVFGLGIGGGCGVGLGLGWGFGNAYGCQYRFSRVQFQAIEFQRNV